LRAGVNPVIELVEPGREFNRFLLSNLADGGIVVD
jgi:hypothetical protein